MRNACRLEQDEDRCGAGMMRRGEGDGGGWWVRHGTEAVVEGDAMQICSWLCIIGMAAALWSVLCWGKVHTTTLCTVDA